MNDQGLLETIGDFIRKTRLAQNKTQSELANAAGINRSTLSQIENGSGGTLSTFIALLRALQKLAIFEQFVIQDQASPLELAKLDESGRQRARNKNKNEKPNSDW